MHTCRAWRTTWATKTPRSRAQAGLTMPRGQNPDPSLIPPMHACMRAQTSRAGRTTWGLAGTGCRLKSKTGTKPRPYLRSPMRACVHACRHPGRGGPPGRHGLQDRGHHAGSHGHAARHQASGGEGNWGVGLLGGSCQGHLAFITTVTVHKACLMGLLYGSPEGRHGHPAQPQASGGGG
jgi:hypothetical protein